MMSDSSEETLLKVYELGLTFAQKPVLSDINFELKPGEILGVVGLRGAGKSLLLQVLAGIHPPSTGALYWKGQRVLWPGLLAAQKQGVEFVPQTLQFVEGMNVVENLFLGRESSSGLLDQPAMVRATYEWLDVFHLPHSLAQQRVGELTDGERQIIGLVRAFLRPARLLLLDEAFSALSFDHQQIAMQRLRHLASRGLAIILTSDDLNFIFSVTDRVLVLYRGEQVALHRTTDVTPRDIVELIVGSSRQERVTPVIWAFENYYAAQQQAEELRQKQKQLQDNLAEQDFINRELVGRLQDQMNALDQLNRALQEANQRLVLEREAERKALARELHDQVIQDLLSFNYQLEDIEDRLAASEHQAELQLIRQGIRDVVTMLRQVCSDLRPPTLDSHGLLSALRSLVSQWSEQTGIAVELQLDESLGRWPETIELTVFRIVQEGLNNVRKHAEATRVELELRRTPAAGLTLRLADNGRGMSAPPDLLTLSDQKHFGLIGISERVSLLRGTMALVTSSTLGGLELRIEIPNPAPFPVS